jgi:hypothetical protein
MESLAHQRALGRRRLDVIHTPGDSSFAGVLQPGLF